MVSTLFPGKYIPYRPLIGKKMSSYISNLLKQSMKLKWILQIGWVIENKLKKPCRWWVWIFCRRAQPKSLNYTEDCHFLDTYKQFSDDLKYTNCAQKSLEIWSAFKSLLSISGELE